MFAIYAYTEDVSWTNIYHYDKDARTLNYETSPHIKDLVQDWYNPPIAWAEQTGVVAGIGDGLFDPTANVTQEEFAQMMYHYAEYKRYDLTARGDLSRYPDGGTVAGWAQTAMEWANGNQLINGHDDGTLEPGGTTTRAQAASILMRFDQKLVEN